MSPNNQHFVPRGYLSAWACGSGVEPKWVWRFDRVLGRVDLKSPRKILREAHIYTVRKPDGTDDFRFERFFQEREDAFYSVRTKLISLQALTHEEWVDLLAFTAAARIRTQMNRNRHRQHWGNAIELGEKMVQSLSKMTPEARTDIAKMQSPSTGKGVTLEQARRLRDEPIQSTLLLGMKQLIERFDHMQAAVLFAAGSTRFITSDNPCVFYDPYARPFPPFRAIPDFRSATFELTMPLTPTACLRLGPDAEGFIELMDDDVAAINNRTAGAASRYMVSSNADGFPEYLGPADWTLGVD
ncbi:DUF4238 domain-containing protein [Variovorax sp. H27-G14]|uniref:DUF4238 domain-containing protein n=1 Tax=Variovorax sp. H27-G14 TaxID=3111914 RepID=UPI0038FC0C20